MGKEIYCIRVHIPVAIKQPHVSVPLYRIMYNKLRKLENA